MAVRMTRPRYGISDDERELVARTLDLEQGLEAWEKSWGPLSDEQKVRRNAVWSQYHDLPGPLTWAWPVKVRGSEIFARFVCLAELRARRGDASPSDWYLSGYLARTSRGTAITHLAVDPEHEDQGSVTTELLRAVRPDEIIAKVRALWMAAADDGRLRSDWGIDPPTPEQLRELELAADGAEGVRPDPGARGFSDDYYRGLALAYLAERQRGRGVIPRLAERYGTSVRKIKDHLNTAKRRGFLQGGGHSGTLSYEAGPQLQRSPATSP